MSDEKPKSSSGNSTKGPGRPSAGAKKGSRRSGSASADPPGSSGSAPPTEPTQSDFSEVSSRFSSRTAPTQLDNEAKREKWGLPKLTEPDKPGSYIIELNVLNAGGLAGAANEFQDLYKSMIDDPKRQPVRISKAYYRCALKDAEWKAIIHADESKNSTDRRAIYRLWPDFPVSAKTDRSVVTVKGDAAYRSFDAAGQGIVWAVLDSGVYAKHPHFGAPVGPDGKTDHLLYNADVVDLHRCFVSVYETVNGIPVDRGELRDPDVDPSMPKDERTKLIEQHREEAFKDDFGHGTHVAGIVAGEAPARADSRIVWERIYTVDPDGLKQRVKFSPRGLSPGAKIRGVAQRCKIVSLKVLNKNGKGRTSDIIQALEYVAERVNDNPKLLKIHGINLSVGYDFDPEMFACGYSPLCSVVDRLVQNGVVVVTAAGNTGYGTAAADAGNVKIGFLNTINDPGNAALAITVGSTHRDSPHMYGVSYFSSKGPTSDGRMKPDIVAPGERITSCAAGQGLARALGDSPEKEGVAYYVDDSGTSMAAPHVSGAIAAFLSVRREFIGKPLEVKRIFLESATPLGRERYFEGRGLVDLMRALQFV